MANSSVNKPSVAYFCMEYGLDASLPIYSGGLGVLAGDMIKAAGDSGDPVVAIGLFWNRGYTRQTIDRRGRPVDAFPATPRDRLERIDADVELEIEGETVALDAYRVDRELARGELILLEPRAAEHRWITERLYGGGKRDRIAQEMILGIGGVRLLRALGREVDVYHFNEGHAVFAGLELVREALVNGATTLADAVATARSKIVFTTHTPVPAGNESHAIDDLAELGALLDLSKDQAAEISGGVPFSMTAAGLRLSRAANGVAELHGETARQMWAKVADAAPIIAITNGVHRPSWQDPSVAKAAGISLGRGQARARPLSESASASGAGDDSASTYSEEPARRKAAESPPDVPAAGASREMSRQQGAALLDAHLANKRALLTEIRERTGHLLSIEGLTIGFARRATTYKRADLILTEPDRLDALLDRGVQLVFAGKAHPADKPGKELVARIVDAAKQFEHIVFVEDYDMTLGALLTRGCDVWLNNPRRPQEACGTSGMKAAMNGVLNLSILDGWWPEGCRHGETGWRIDAGHYEHPVAQDQADHYELFRVLHEEVLPAWADRDRWAEMMRNSIEMSSEQFSAARMLRDYYEKLYVRR